jgi:hypothetical protein
VSNTGEARPGAPDRRSRSPEGAARGRRIGAPREACQTAGVRSASSRRAG